MYAAGGQTPPVTDTRTVDMPVPLYPTCLDIYGCMVALGTREGPVLLFDVGPPDDARSFAPPPPLLGGRRPHLETVASSSGHGGSGGNRSGGVSNDSSGGSRSNSGGSSSSISSGRGTSTSVTRVYGSLADGTGPVSSVILDRAKLIAAGRGSRRSGGGHVIR